MLKNIVSQLGEGQDFKSIHFQNLHYRKSSFLLIRELQSWSVFSNYKILSIGSLQIKQAQRLKSYFLKLENETFQTKVVSHLLVLLLLEAVCQSGEPEGDL